MLKVLFALLLVSCAVAVASADFSPFPFAGTYRDSRFGGYAYLCNTNDRMQGSASGQLFFVDNRNNTGEASGYRQTLTGNYYSTNAGKTGDVGTYELSLNDNGDYVGWYFKNGKSTDAWPWVLARVARQTDGTLPSGHCLDSQEVGVPTLNSKWIIGSNLNTLQLCIDSKYTEGTIFNSSNAAVAYLYGQSYENGHIFVGRQYQIADATTAAGEICSDFGNAIYRVVENNGVVSLVGFVTRGNLINNPQIQYVQATQDSNVDSTTCDDGDNLRKCEAGIYFPELRSSASAVVSSLFAVALFAVVAVLF